MRVTVIGLALTLLAGAAVAQQQGARRVPQTDKTFASAAQIAALIAKAKRDIKPGQPSVSEPILRLAPYSANLQYRIAVGPGPEVHEHQAEMFYVIDGSGTLTTGGKLVGEKRRDPDDLTGTTIEGGRSQDVAKGDVIIVPENTPHWFTKVNGVIILMTLHVPRPVAAAH